MKLEKRRMKEKKRRDRRRGTKRGHSKERNEGNVTGEGFNLGTA